ncbi:restriction endonuclease [filamentous cyanobacterium Phorm 46]|nr:restriction endonuclease [filamentous cyanobacterium Phorm 46]
MNGQIYHFSPDFLNLLVDTIPRLCKSRDDVLIFFYSAGVSNNFLADLSDRLQSERLQRKEKGISKYEIARTALVRLNDVGDTAIRERREIVRRVVEFNDFSRCWPNEQIAAQGFVAKVRDEVKFKDFFTRIQQKNESKLEAEREKRQQQEKERLELLHQKIQKRKDIRYELIALYQEADTKRRGKQLEIILNRLFESEGLLVRESFTITGEHKEGVIQQVDGAIEVNSYLYIVEMKWWKEKLGPPEVMQHMMRLFQRSDVRGIFISASGYTDAAIIDIQKALNQRIVTLFTLKELILLLEGENSFESLLKSKVEAIQLDGKLLYEV